MVLCAPVLIFAYLILNTRTNKGTGIEQAEREYHRNAEEKTQEIEELYPAFIEWLGRESGVMTGRDQIKIVHYWFAGPASEDLRMVMLFFLKNQAFSEEERHRSSKEAMKILEACLRQHKQKRNFNLQYEARTNLQTFMRETINIHHRAKVAL